ncbi:MAG TPA: hypothetical protein VGR96_05670 [Acidobacteriaceae bacterium]|nr:hypothetical protein [Acidobacteriaceae bacterium]
MTDYALPADETAASPVTPASSGVEAAPGLPLPSVGRLWALDSYSGKPELVRLKYRAVELDNHTGSNLWKTQAAPFFYKPKKTLDVKGKSAEVRLHDASPVFFLRSESWADSESADGTVSSFDWSALSLVRLQVKSDRRIAATIAFTQVTASPSRSDSAVETVKEKIPGTDWYKVSPKQPLAPGEYGWMALPNRQDTFGVTLYDFAIDGTAPENAGAVRADSDAAPQAAGAKAAATP